MKKLSIVIPCYNSAPNIAGMETALLKLKQSLANYELEVVLVDDGSKDNTFELLLQLSQRSPIKIKLVKLTGNFGSYNAFLAGLNHGSGDVYAQLHPDLQDPPEHLPQMLSFWEKGVPFVIAVRTAREESFLNQLFSSRYHRSMKKALPHIPEGGYDLIVFDKALRDHVVKMNESNTNLVYLISWLKYPYVTVPITRVARKEGKSQWTFSKKSKLWVDSIVSFSYAPIRLISCTTLLINFISIFFAAFFLFSDYWSTKNRFLLVGALIFGNILLVFISIIGEYLWRTLEAARNRPPFIAEKVIEN